MAEGLPGTLVQPQHHKQSNNRRMVHIPTATQMLRDSASEDRAGPRLLARGLEQVCLGLGGHLSIRNTLLSELYRMCTISTNVVKAGFCLQDMCEELGRLSQGRASAGPRGAHQNPHCNSQPTLPPLHTGRRNLLPTHSDSHTSRATPPFVVVALLYVVGCSAFPYLCPPAAALSYL